MKKTKAQAPKAAAKVYDNDNLPAASINVVGGAKTTAATGNSGSNQSNATATVADASTAASSPDKPPAVKPGQSLEDRKKVIDDWKSRIDEQKAKVDQLTKDLNEFQHNSTLGQVSLWPETQQYGQQLAEKKKALDQAKAQLSDLQEQARKAGVPSSAAE
jgi:uncharacterized coiled-coil protein SlyX